MTMNRNRKPERLLNKSRRKYARTSSPKISAAGKSSLMETIPTDEDELSFRSENDDMPRLGNLCQKQEWEKPTDSDKLGKPSKSVICGKRRDFGGISDSSSSSSSSDESIEVEEVHKSKTTKHNKFHSHVAVLPENSNRKQKTRLSLTSLIETQGKVSDAGARMQTAPIYAARHDLITLEIPEDITSASQLKWYVMQLGEMRTILQPCWVLSPGEASEQKRRMEGKFKGNTGGSSIMIRYLKFPNVGEGMCKSVAEHTLVPLERKSNDGSTTDLNEHYLERYIKEQSRKSRQEELYEIRLFIERIFDHAKELEEKAREQSEKERLDYYDDSNSEKCGGNKSSLSVTGDKRVQFDVVENTDDEADNEKEDLEVPYTQATTYDPDAFGPAEAKSNEPIRQGDVIEYYSPIFVAGDTRGLRQASILSVKPDDETALVLANGEVLPNDTKVKRIKVLRGDELLDHPGIFRPIYRFNLVKGGSATAADAVNIEAARFGRIMQKNMSKLKEKAESDGFAPMDLLLVKGVKDDTAARSVLRSKPSSTVQCCRKRYKPLSSSSSDESSSCDSHVVQEKQMKEHNLAVKCTTENKENNGLISCKGKRMSLGSLSSLDSLGSSLASSDSSIDSTMLLNMGLGKDDAKITRSDKPDRLLSTNSRKKSDAKPQDRKATRDLSLLSDDDMRAKELAKAKSKTPENGPLKKNCLGLRKQPAASEPRWPLPSGTKYRSQGPSKEGAATAASGSKNCLSSDDESRVNRSRGNIRGHTKSLPCSSSPGLKRVANGGKSIFLSSTNSLPSYDSSSSADSGNDTDSKPQRYSKTAPKQLSRQSITSLVSTEEYLGPNNKEDLLIELDSLGWTQGIAGWKKSSPAGQRGLSVCRVKK